MFSCSISIFLSGGLAVFSLHATILGLFGFGFFYAGLICPGYAEIITVMEDLVHRPQYDSHHSAKTCASSDRTADTAKVEKVITESNVTDKSSALMGLGYASGATIGPILGGYLYDMDGYNFATNIMSAAILTNTFVYLCQVFRRQEPPSKELNRKYQGFEDERAATET